MRVSEIVHKREKKSDFACKIMDFDIILTTQ